MYFPLVPTTAHSTYNTYFQKVDHFYTGTAAPPPSACRNTASAFAAAACDLACTSIASRRSSAPCRARPPARAGSAAHARKTGGLGGAGLGV